MTLYQEIEAAPAAPLTTELCDERLYRIIWQRLKHHKSSEKPLTSAHVDCLHDIIVQLEDRYRWNGAKLHSLRVDQKPL